MPNSPLFADCRMLVAFYHTCEHLADALWGAISPQANRWHEEYRNKLLHEEKGVDQVLPSTDYYGQKRRWSKTRRAALGTQRTFFWHNKTRMNYAVFRRQGLPVGSGPVEADCKTLVKTHLCRSGMRWSWLGGQRKLQLRTYVKSDCWEAFRKQYKQRWPDQFDRAA